MTSLVLLATASAGNLALSALFLWLGARWVKAPGASFPRALLVTLVIGVVSVLLVLAATWLQAEAWAGGAIAFLAVQGVCLFGQVLLAWLIIRSAFRTTLPRAIAAWAVSLVGGIAALAFVLGVIGPYVLEAFVVSTNPMPPAAVGWHRRGTCPNVAGPRT